MFSVKTKNTAGRTAALTLAGSLLLANVTMLGGCASKSNIKGLTVDKVIKTLEKDFKAEEYEDEIKDASTFLGDFDDGYYLTGEGNTEVAFMSFCGMYRGGGNGLYMYKEVRYLQKYVTENDCEYVFYSQLDPKEGLNKATGAIMAFIEFEDDDDAMDCFEDIMADAYFDDEPGHIYQVWAYENALDAAEDNIDRYEGTVLGDYIAKNSKDQNVVEIDDLNKANYTCDSKSARFDYNLRWECLIMGDYARANPDDEDIIEESSVFTMGVMGHHLCVEGNKLLLIYGFDFDKSKGEVETVSKLCKAFSTGNPFDVKMDNDLKKYLLYIHNKWNPGTCRLDKY